MADLIDPTEAADLVRQGVFLAEKKIEKLPGVEPDRKTGCLTEDEIKAIRIHMNAFKERLCNQHRWKEAEEYQQIVDKLDAMLPQSEPHWIPCSERLPDSEVLCCDNHGEMMLGYVFACDDGKTPYSAENEHEYMYDCVAWMPLPEPYKEGTE